MSDEIKNEDTIEEVETEEVEAERTVEEPEEVKDQVEKVNQEIGEMNTADDHKSESMGEKIEESMKKTDGTRIWVIFNTFVSLISLAFIVTMWVTTM